MILRNTANNSDIAINLNIADTFLPRFWGLMGKSSWTYCDALLLKPCNSIHMFFMKFSIDAVFLDENMRVVRIIPKIKPWRITRVIPSATSVLELPVGTAELCKISQGDILELINN